MVVFHGLAAPYGVPTRLDGDVYRTSFHIGAFASSIRSSRRSSRVGLWINHRPAAVLAWRAENDVGLHEGPDGLSFFATVRDPIWARLLREQARDGRITGCSVAWNPGTVCDVWAGGDRIILMADLVEVSICCEPTRPQFPGTWAAISRPAVDGDSKRTTPHHGQ